MFVFGVGTRETFVCCVQISVLKKHHRAAHYGHHYECMVKFRGVSYAKVGTADCSAADGMGWDDGMMG